MQIEVADFLRLCEGAGTILYFDIESSGFNADYNRVLTFSGQWHGKKKPFTITAKTHRSEKAALERILKVWNKADIVVSYYGRGFDVPFLNARLFEYGLPLLDSKHHLDLYYTLKPKFKLSRKSLDSMGTLAGIPEDKMKVPPRAWREVDIPILVKRCESDVKMLVQLYRKVKHLIKTISR